MNDLIQIKSGALGNRAGMPYLNGDELGYRTDTKELYIGRGNENIRLCGAGDLARVISLENKILSLEGKIATLESKNSSLESKISTLEAEIEALKSTGE